MSEIYYVKKPFFKEALMAFAFRKNVDWLEEGMSLLSWKYKKIANFNSENLKQIYSYYRLWNGNKKTKIAGHRTMSIGDIVIANNEVKLITGYGWVSVPQTIWKRVIKD